MRDAAASINVRMLWNVVEMVKSLCAMNLRVRRRTCGGFDRQPQSYMVL